jgi:hypothetical protein
MHTVELYTKIYIDLASIHRLKILCNPSHKADAKKGRRQFKASHISKKQALPNHWQEAYS